ncbi:DUF86 domain-containing protein [Chengkuizengella axinellae]|uniref:DUF86 domain-containing protein n=1 Tax=Chengkuizengella axinellae TaxID=3064388 RepID=A0ABT9J279_9BACL|nr:DUF86 domain-containing protein [Chengkuizengella sp. 2205SS18-9]MDP5275725.1 DUF86 domain-containing protein [Chengkuizengella sp. 2205SS18-9]
MYYVNQDQINLRLEFIERLVEMIPDSIENQKESPSVINGLAQERILHLALESVTDIGSYIIDGFLMRDASSYEDIIEIIYGEKVFPPHLLEPLLSLVKMRKKLVQEYFNFDQSEIFPLLSQLPDILAEFSQSVKNYLKQEII